MFLRFTRAMMLVSALYTMTVSCKREDVPDEMADKYITITSGLINTKGLMYSSDMTDPDIEIKLFDLVPSSTSRPVNIDGATASYGTPVWSIGGEYPDGRDGYPWILDANERYTHNFFAWLTQDKDGQAADDLTEFDKIEDESDDDTYVYGISNLTMNLTSQQFDFCYSDVIKRDLAATSDFSAVNIPLKHLFTSFGIKARNYDNGAITIHSVKLYGVNNTATAKLIFETKDGTGVVTPEISDKSSEWSGSANGLELLDGDINIASGDEVNNVITVTGKNTSATDAYYLMWPQTASEMEYTIRKDANGDPIMGEIDYSQAILLVEYSSGGGSRITTPVALCPIGKEQGWDAGSRHLIELAFTNKFLQLDVEVLDWNYEDEAISYTSTITAMPDLQFNTCTLGPETDEYDTNGNHYTCRNVYFTNGQPITCTFLIQSPVNGTWMISKEGSFDAFEVDNLPFAAKNDGEEYSYGTIDGNSATVKIFPKIDDPQIDYTMNLSFAVRLSNGDVVSADDLIYKMEEGEYKRYTIVLQH